MREQLVIYKGQKIEFEGSFHTLTYTKIRRDLTALFHNVRDIAGNIFIDHMWSTVEICNENVGLGSIRKGKAVKFVGYVREYRKNDGTKTLGIDNIIITEK